MTTHNIVRKPCLQIASVALALAVAMTAGCGGGGGGGTGGLDPGSPESPVAPPEGPSLPQVLTWRTFPLAGVVIGQPDFESGDQPVGIPALDQLRFPVGSPVVTAGDLFVAGTGGLRAFSNYDAASGATARFGIDVNARGVSTQGGKLVYVGDHQVKIYGTAPSGEGATPEVTVGATGLPGCEAGRMNTPRAAVITPRGQLVVADTNNNRVLIWNTIPESGQAGNADIVIGQGRKNICQPNDVNEDGLADSTLNEQTLNAPSSVWSDGVRLVVVDQGNHRVLIWDQFPLTEFQAATRVIGQSDFTLGEANAGQVLASDTALFNPESVDVRESGQMAVADAGNHRVLVWDRFPSRNSQPADQVIGQANFSTNSENAGGNPGQGTLRTPMGVRFDDRNLIVVDRDNHRVLVFRSEN